MTQSVQALLESFREYKRQEFKANSKALNNLIEMGFEEEDVRDALRITGNNQASAVRHPGGLIHLCQETSTSDSTKLL